MTDYIVSSGQTSSLVLNSGDTETVMSGGSATFTTVNSGGLLTVMSGGTDLSATINSSGSETLFGSGSFDTITDGGTETVSSGGLASFDAISSGGLLTVMSGGTDLSATINSSGSETLFGSGSFDTITDGGTETMSSGSLASFDAISSGGSLIVMGSGTATSTTIFDSGSEIISGGVAVFAVVSSGGSLIVEGPLFGSAISVTILSGGSETVSSTGMAALTTVTNGGVLTVASAGTAEFENILSGGSVSVTASGVEEYANVSSGGLLIGSGGGIVANLYDNKVLSSGSETVAAGGSAHGDVISNGGVLIVSSGGIGQIETVSSGGSLTVLSGGTGIRNVIEAGGTETVSSGGSSFDDIIIGQSNSGNVATLATANFGQINSGGFATLDGGLLHLLSGAIVSSGVTFSAGGGGELQIEGASAPSVPISGFNTANDAIDLTGLVFSGNSSVDFNSVTDVVTVTEGGSSTTIQLDSEDYTGVTWSAAQDAGSGTEIAVACFLRGTLILTGHGQVAVEDLAIGDRVVSLAGSLRAIKWIGRRAYDGMFAANNRAVLPIRVAAGALAPGIPARDLLLSPEHALYLDGRLVPAGELINGTTIARVESADRMEYFHIELDGHDVILAEGAPAETYVDCDNRFMFQNGDEFACLYPDDTPKPWDFCAPRAEPGSAELAAVQAALGERAGALGYSRYRLWAPTTSTAAAAA
jgi:autotransporter passenger strand-loop-strand repeat protein